jgi:hypothetical protein
METMRMYRIWAGKPSYRVMEHQCGRRFAASTIHIALRVFGFGKSISISIIEPLNPRSPSVATLLDSAWQEQSSPPEFHHHQIHS